MADKRVSAWRFELSPDQQFLRLQIKDEGNTVTAYEIPLASAAAWLGQQIDLIGLSGKALPHVPDGAAEIIPPEHVHVCTPPRVSLNRTGPEPILNMDLGWGVLGFRVHRKALLPVLQEVMTHYPDKSDHGAH